MNYGLNDSFGQSIGFHQQRFHYSCGNHNHQPRCTLKAFKCQAICLRWTHFRIDIDYAIKKTFDETCQNLFSSCASPPLHRHARFVGHYRPNGLPPYPPPSLLWKNHIEFIYGPHVAVWPACDRMCPTCVVPISHVYPPVKNIFTCKTQVKSGKHNVMWIPCAPHVTHMSPHVVYMWGTCGLLSLSITLICGKKHVKLEQGTTSTPHVNLMLVQCDLIRKCNLTAINRHAQHLS